MEKEFTGVFFTGVLLRNCYFVRIFKCLAPSRFLKRRTNTRRHPSLCWLFRRIPRRRIKEFAKFDEIEKDI